MCAFESCVNAAICSSFCSFSTASKAPSQHFERLSTGTLKISSAFYILARRMFACRTLLCIAVVTSSSGEQRTMATFLDILEIFCETTVLQEFHFCPSFLQVPR